MDEGAGTVQVCMHLGGEDLVDNVSLFTLDGTARGKFNVAILRYSFHSLIFLIRYCCRGKRLFKSSAKFHIKFWRKEMLNY